jgi:hypothetical protein
MEVTNMETKIIFGIDNLYRLKCCMNFQIIKDVNRPPLWCSGQTYWPQIQRSWVRFQAIPDFLKISGSAKGQLNFVGIIGKLLQ